MSARVTAAAALSILLALALLWWRSSAEEASPAPRTGAGIEQPLRAPLDMPAGVESSEERAAVMLDVPSPAPPAVPAAPGRDLQVVRVVERSTGAPVPDAEVLWLRMRPADMRNLGLNSDKGARRTGRVEELLEEQGERTRADSLGAAYVSRGTEHLAIVGSAPGMFGYGAEPGDAPGELRLELGPDASVDVEVVDASGAPAAGIPVALRLGHGWPPAYEDSVRTDVAGRARLRHVLLPRGDVSVLAAAVAALLREPLQVELDPAALPDQPVRLVLPPLGSLEVVVRMRDGSLLPHGSVEIMAQPPRPGASAAVPFSPSAREPVVGGRAIFEHVALSVDLRIMVQSPRSQWAATIQNSSGPVLAGERKTVEVMLGSGFPTVRLRALDDHGGPLARTDLEVRLNQLSRPAGFLHPVRTDGSGRFEVDLWESFLEEDWTKWRLMVLAPAAPGHPPREGIYSLAPPYLEAVHDLGDLRLLPAPLLASGMVLDRSGAPLAATEVWAQVLAAEAPEADRRWMDIGVTVRTTAAEGTFELWGSLPPGPIAVVARREGMAQARVECERGSTGLQLQLSEAATLAGRILLDAGMRNDQIRLRAEPATGAGNLPPLGWLQGSLRPDGTFALHDLSAGTWTLLVHLQQIGAPVELRRIEGLRVQAGETLRDPRLDPIDLRGAARALRIEFLVPPGGQNPRGFCEWREAGAATIPERVYESDGWIELFLRETPLDVATAFFGYRTVRLHSVAEDRRVELSLGLPVRLRLPLGLRLPETARLVAFMAMSTPSGTTTTSSGRMAFDSKGELALRACDPGTASVHVLLERAPGGGRTGQAALPARQFQLVESDAEQILVLDITQAQIDAALAELRR